MSGGHGSKSPRLPAPRTARSGDGGERAVHMLRERQAANAPLVVFEDSSRAILEGRNSSHRPETQQSTGGGQREPDLQQPLKEAEARGIDCGLHFWFEF